MSRVAESIEWIAVDDELPDDDTTVLVAFSDAPPWLGWHEAGEWFGVGGEVMDGVTHWAACPEGPGA